MRNDLDDKALLTAAELVKTKFIHQVTYEPANALGKGGRARLVNHSPAPFPYLADVSYTPRAWVSGVTVTSWPSG